MNKLKKNTQEKNIYFKIKVFLFKKWLKNEIIKKDKYY